MHNIHLKHSSTKDALIQLQKFLNGSITEAYGEYVLTFNNVFGNGVIRGIDFDWGLSLIDFNVNLVELTKITFENNERKLVEFIFISEGHLEFKEDLEEASFMNFNRYQNIIISSKIHSKKVFVLPKATQVKVNVIQLDTISYKEKKNNNLSSLDKTLHTVFESQNETASYHHLGNYNLKIADIIKQLDNTPNTGIRTLCIEGQLNLIMAMQMLEHQNSQIKEALQDSLSKEHIKKIQELSTYISDNISEPLSIDYLSKLSGLGPKKLQMGFKVLYSKSVNEYIRDIKLEVSRDQLKHSDLTISEIVYTIGFNSRSYFSKIFFERYNILPKDYRNNNKKKLKTI